MVLVAVVMVQLCLATTCALRTSLWSSDFMKVCLVAALGLWCQFFFPVTLFSRAVNTTELVVLEASFDTSKGGWGAL